MQGVLSPGCLVLWTCVRLYFLPARENISHWGNSLVIPPRVFRATATMRIKASLSPKMAANVIHYPAESA